MKKLWLLVLALVVINAGVIVALAGSGGDGDDLTSAVRASAEGEGEEEEEEEGGLGPASPDDYFLFQRSTRGDVPNAQDFRRSVRQARTLRREAAQARAAQNVRAARWALEGPTNIGGRLGRPGRRPHATRTASTSRRPPAASGGRPTPAPRSSRPGPMTPRSRWARSPRGPTARSGPAPASSTPAAAASRSAAPASTSPTTAATSWRRRGLENSGTTGRIVTNPTNPDVAYVAAGGSLFNAGGQRGIYKTTNGGRTWDQVLAPETPFTGGADLVMDPRNPLRLYAAMWDHRREPDVRTYGGVGSGLFRTDNGGETWKRLENVVTKTPGDATGLVSDPSLGRIGVTLAPSNPDRVYVITTATFGQDKGFYVSNDAGESFNTAALPGSQGGFGWWFGRIWVDPANQDHLFVAGVNLRESSNAGLTWGNSGGLHADQHAMEWDAKVPNRVYEGNDGGLYRSDANGATQTWTKATYEPYTQHYQVEVAETDPSRLTGGTQDNGCIRSWRHAESVERLRLRRRRVRPDRLERPATSSTAARSTARAAATTRAAATATTSDRTSRTAPHRRAGTGTRRW